jgi:hypothetical protein
MTEKQISLAARKAGYGYVTTEKDSAGDYYHCMGIFTDARRRLQVMSFIVFETKPLDEQIPNLALYVDFPDELDLTQ